MKLFFLEKQKAALISLLLSVTMSLRNIFIPSIYLGIVLDSKLDFKFHVDQKIKKSNKLIGLIRQHDLTPRIYVLHKIRLR